MKIRCKSGDLALVIHDEEACGQNIGRLVKVAGPLGLNQRLKKMCWLIEPVIAQPWHCLSPKKKHYKLIVTFATDIEHPDEWLLPIAPEALNLEEGIADNPLKQPGREQEDLFQKAVSSTTCNMV